MSIALTRRAVEKVWGREDLAAPFSGEADRRIGEIWFEPQAPLESLLVKYLFTSEKLSLQVHPSDAHADRMGLGATGKEECWLILDAEPGAAVALGLDGEYSADAVRCAALDGSIEDMLAWHEAKPGDFFHVPPGTIHAIGAGLTLLEIQQNADITYRLFDYGRPRQLHLEEAIECAEFSPHPASCRGSVGHEKCELLLDCDPFAVTLLRGTNEFVVPEPVLIVPLAGRVRIGESIFAYGSCALLAGDEVLASSDEAQFVMVRPMHTQDSA